MFGLMIRQGMVLGCIALLIVAGLKWQYAKGYAEAQHQAEFAASDQQLKWEKEKNHEQEKYQAAVLARQSAEKRIDALQSRINWLRKNAHRPLQPPSAASSANGARADGIGLFGACLPEYADLGKETARLADKVRGLQNWAKSVARAP